MTDRQMLSMLSVMVGETDADALETYLFLAKKKLLAILYPYSEKEEIPPKYEGVLLEIAQFMMNKRGTEGEKRHAENGVDITYDSGDIPNEILRRITPVCGVF